MNLFMTETNMQKQTCSCQEEGRQGGMDWEFWNQKQNYYIEWINEKVLLYSTGIYPISVSKHTRKIYKAINK